MNKFKQYFRLLCALHIEAHKESYEDNPYETMTISTKERVAWLALDCEIKSHKDATISRIAWRAPFPSVLLSSFPMFPIRHFVFTLLSVRTMNALNREPSRINRRLSQSATFPATFDTSRFVTSSLRALFTDRKCRLSDLFGGSSDARETLEYGLQWNPGSISDFIRATWIWLDASARTNALKELAYESM